MNLNVLSRIDGFLNRLFDAGERRTHPGQINEEWLRRLGRFADTAAGVDVDEHNALQIAAVWSCVKVLAESVAQLPLVLYRQTGARSREQARDHRLFSLLHDAPNSEMTSFVWREMMMGHLATWGNAYSELELNKSGEVLGIWPLRPDRTAPERINGTIKFGTKLPNGQKRFLAAENVLHIPGLGYDGMIGYSPVAMARETMGLAKATEQFGATWFGNGARPSGFLRHPGHLTDKAGARLKASFEEQHQGLDRANRMGLLEEGMEWQAIGVPPEDAQFLETRKFQVTDIARIYHVPPHMVGDLESGASYASIEQMSLEFVIYTMMPWYARFEQQINKSVLTALERASGLYVRFNVSGLLRGDNASRWESYNRALDRGVYSINDVRALEDMNPVEGGDVHLVPLNMIPLEQVMEAPASGAGAGARDVVIRHNEILRRLAPQNDMATGAGEMRAARLTRIGRGRLRLAQSYELVMREAAGRVIRREVADVGRAVRKHLGQRNEVSFVEWLQEFYRNHVEFWIRTMRPILLSYADLVGMNVGEELGIDPLKAGDVEEFIGRYVQALAARETSSSETQLRALLDQAVADGEDSALVLETRLGEWDERRSAKVANENSRTGLCALALAFYGATRLVTRWRVVNVGDTCAYCQALSGLVVGIDEVIIKAGDEFQPEGTDRPLTSRHDIHHPQFHDGCDCQVAAEMG